MKLESSGLPVWRSPKPRGFALVVTLVLLVILTVLAVGLLGLSTISFRTDSIVSAEQHARDNARMALMLAIGRLQETTGQDTRITAPANLVNQNHPQLLGAWRSWEGQNHEPNGRPIPPDYSSKAVSAVAGGRFVDWLVSSATLTDGSDISEAATLIQTTPGNHTIPLLAEGSLATGDARQVHVALTPISNRGKYAWWVSGENQKARLAQPYQPRNNNPAGLMEMGQSHTISNPETFGLSSLLNEAEDHNTETGGSKDVRKAVTRQSMALIEADAGMEPEKAFHDFSTQASGLLTNAATGGWRKDLSLLTERWDHIYNTYPGGRLPLFRLTPGTGGSTTTQVPRPTTTLFDPPQSNLYPWSEYSVLSGPANTKQPATYHAAAASWKSLQSFATAYKNFSINQGVVESPFVWDVIAARANLNSTKVYNYKHTQRLYPQIARFQFLIYAKANQTSNPGVTPIRYRIDLLYVPVITLWNPYNVGLTYDVPSDPSIEALGFGWRRSLPGALAIVNQQTYPNPGAVPSNQYRMVSNGNFQYLDVNGNFNNEYDTNLPGNVSQFSLAAPNRCNTLVDMRTTLCSLPPGRLSFKPGEAKVFSPSGQVVSGFGGTGFGLMEGYNPTTMNGRLVNGPLGNLTATQSVWILFKNNRFTQPYRNRNAGLGFTLSFGKTTGPPYLGMALHSGLNDEYHNITALAPEAEGSLYWPASEISEIGYSVGALASGPWIPIVSMTMGPRTTIGTAVGTAQNRPTKGMVQNNPLASMSLINPVSAQTKSHPVNGTFDMTYHSLSMGSTLTPNLSASRGFIATGHQSGDGLSRVIACDIPLRPMASLVELQGWNPRGHNPYPPFQHNLIGNSDATPLIPINRVVPPTLDPSTPATNLLHDDAYCANHLLFDDWFVSSIAPMPVTFGGDISKDIYTYYADYLRGQELLTNRAYKRIRIDRNLSPTQVTDRMQRIIDNHDGWQKVASRFDVEGMFNVNSTSIPAWKALLGRAKNLDQVALFGANEIVSHDLDQEHVVTRGPIASDVEAGLEPGFGAQFAKGSEYTGYRALSDAQIEDLATRIVEQVRLRGPFLSLSEFVNRQLSSNTNLALAGAVQSAINSLNDDPMAQLRNPANALSDNTMALNDPKLAGVNYEFPDAAVGDSAYGAPGWIRQADILRPIAPVLSVRDDTFTIRAYGDYRDDSGKVLAKAWCEAVVQRTRDFCDRADAADSTSAPVSVVNQTFGRRYQVISFKWLNPDEV